MNDIKCKNCKIDTLIRTDRGYKCHDCGYELIDADQIPLLHLKFTLNDLWMIRTGLELLLDNQDKKKQEIKSLMNTVYHEIDIASAEVKEV